MSKNTDKKNVIFLSVLPQNIIKSVMNYYRACSAVVIALRFGTQGPVFEPGLFHKSMLHASSWLLNEAKSCCNELLLFSFFFNIRNYIQNYFISNHGKPTIKYKSIHFYNE